MTLTENRPGNTWAGTGNELEREEDLGPARKSVAAMMVFVNGTALTVSETGISIGTTNGLTLEGTGVTVMVPR